jgi:hypothetical protein
MTVSIACMQAPAQLMLQHHQLLHRLSTAMMAATPLTAVSNPASKTQHQLQSSRSSLQPPPATAPHQVTVLASQQAAATAR